MMSGMSNEKPALDRVLDILHIWSAYEVIGEVMMKMGAMCVMIALMKDMILRQSIPVSDGSLTQVLGI